MQNLSHFQSMTCLYCQNADAPFEQDGAVAPLATMSLHGSAVSLIFTICSQFLDRVGVDEEPT